jgi:hypothetical protein
LDSSSSCLGISLGCLYGFRLGHGLGCSLIPSSFSPSLLACRYPSVVLAIDLVLVLQRSLASSLESDWKSTWKATWHKGYDREVCAKAQRGSKATTVASFAVVPTTRKPHDRTTVSAPTNLRTKMIERTKADSDLQCLRAPQPPAYGSQRSRRGKRRPPSAAHGLYHRPRRDPSRVLAHLNLPLREKTPQSWRIGGARSVPLLMLGRSKEGDDCGSLVEQRWRRLRCSCGARSAPAHTAALLGAALFLMCTRIVRERPRRGRAQGRCAPSVPRPSTVSAFSCATIEGQSPLGAAAPSFTTWGRLL